MATRVRSGTPTMCTVMDPPERIECVLTSSGVNPSLAALALMVSARRTVMISEALNKRSP